MTVWGDTTGKSTAQTGGTTMYTLASLNLKSDAQTKYTTSGKVWTFDSTFDGLDAGQEAWTFGVPTPGAAALMGLAALLSGRRRN
jgi:MYXO-CTERM domain-containing protein